MMEGFVPIHDKLGEGFSTQEVAKSWEHPGRRTQAHAHQSPAFWIDELGARKLCILLCSFCRPKFNYKKHHYRKFYAADISGITDGHAVNGKCDDCKQFTANKGGGTAFLHEEEYSKICQDPISARRQARASGRTFSVSRFLGIGR